MTESTPTLVVTALTDPSFATNTPQEITTLTMPTEFSADITINDTVEAYRRDRIVFKRAESNAALVSTITMTPIVPTNTGDLVRICPIQNSIIVEPDATLTTSSLLNIDLLQFPTPDSLIDINDISHQTWTAYAYVDYFHTDTRTFGNVAMTQHDLGASPVVEKITDTNNANTYVDRQSDYWVRFTTDKKVFSGKEAIFTKSSDSNN